MNVAAGSRPVAAAARRAWMLPVLLPALALLVRLVFALDAPPYITWSDGRQYENVALSLVRGEGYGIQTLRPPGYPTFMAAVWSLTGHDLRALRVVEAGLGALAVWAITWIGMRRFGRTAGLISGAIAALHPVLAYLPSTQYTENTLVVILVAAYGLVLAALEPGGVHLRRWIGAGALFGAAMLWRPNLVLLLPGLVLTAAWLLARQRRAVVIPLAACLATAIAVLAPWIVRNHQVHGRWFFVATGGGRALWLGNNPQLAAGPYTITLPDSALLARQTGPGEFAYDEALRREALAYMRADPGRAAGLYLRRLGQLFALHPETYTRSRYMSDLGRISQSLASLVIFAGALLALPRLRRTPSMAPLLAGVITFSLATAVFFAVMRYRMPVEPVLIWMAGIGWAGLPMVQKRERR